MIDFNTQISQLNMIATQLEARMEKGQLLWKAEKDTVRRNQIEIQFQRLKNSWLHAIAAIELLSGSLRNEGKGNWCSVCLGLINEDDLRSFFADYQEASTGKVGVPE